MLRFAQHDTLSGTEAGASDRMTRRSPKAIALSLGTSGRFQDGALSESSRHPPPILRGAMQVVERLDPVIDQRRGPLRDTRFEALTAQGLFGSDGAPGDGRRAGKPESNVTA
jgi:hypothetical protein